jgi:hypothetical protein
MGSDQVSTANYAAVIDDLRAKREELDRTISLLEAMSKVAAPQSSNQEIKKKIEEPAQSETETGDQSLLEPGTISRSHGIGERCAAILRDQGAGKSLSTREVTDALFATGFNISAKNPTNNVWSALNHRSKVVGDVRREGNNWAYVRRPDAQKPLLLVQEI